MQVYHYTSLSALAMILHSKRIRFSRLDTLDDIRETAGIPAILPYHLYVSCWTLDEKENIVLWDMYTRTRGIRIQLPKVFYNNYNIGLPEHNLLKEYLYPLPLDESENDVMYFRAMAAGEDALSMEVEYCQDAELTKRQQFELGPGSVKTSNWNNLVRYKDDQWAFQKEFRYYFAGALKISPNKMPEYLDVPINEDVFNNIKIRLHPNSGLDSELIVRALLEKYTSNGTVEFSHLTGIVRPKNHL